MSKLTDALHHFALASGYLERHVSTTVVNKWSMDEQARLEQELARAGDAFEAELAVFVHRVAVEER